MRRVIADQVEHFRTGAQQGGRAKRPAGNGPDMLLELGRDGAIHGPVAGIVHARRDFVDDQRVAALACAHEELDAEHADIIQRLGNAPRGCDGFISTGPGKGCRHHGTVQDVVAMLVFRGIEGTETAIETPRRDHGDLTAEPDEGFEDRRLPAHGRPGRLRTCHRRELGLSLAVIAQARGLEHGGKSDHGEGGDQFGVAGDAGKGCRGGLKAAGKLLFGQPVLRNAKRLRARPDRHAGFEEAHRADRNVLELEGDGIDGAGETGQGHLVVIARARVARGHAEGRAVRLGREDVAVQAKLRG